MLESCFKAKINIRKMLPTTRCITGELPYGNFERNAFSALYKNRTELNIKEIYSCRNARVDGFLITNDNEIILLEMKETLGWGSTQAAGFQFIAGNHLLKLNAKKGIIVFQKFSKEWERTTPYGAFGQLALEAEAFYEIIQIGGLQVLENGLLQSYAETNP